MNPRGSVPGFSDGALGLWKNFRTLQALKFRALLGHSSIFGDQQDIGPHGGPLNPSGVPLGEEEGPPHSFRPCMHNCTSSCDEIGSVSLFEPALNSY